MLLCLPYSSTSLYIPSALYYSNSKELCMQSEVWAQRAMRAVRSVGSGELAALTRRC